MSERRFTEAEWRARDDLRKNWHTFCDCDAFEGRDTFPERMEAAGFIRTRAVTKRDVADDYFAAERGIELGGMLWELTAKGRKVLSQEPRP